MRPLNRTYENKLFRSEIEHEHTMWWNWYYDYDDSSYYDQFDDYGYIDKELEKEILNEVLLGTRFRKRRYAYLAYRVVDMESFYIIEIYLLDLNPKSGIRCCLS